MIIKNQILLVFLFFCTNQIVAQRPSSNVRWIDHSETINNGYTIHFKYPSYYKYDWIENGLCLGKKDEKSEYNNTMEWGIWMDYPQNYQEPNPKSEGFKEYFIWKKDIVVISGYSGLRTILKHKYGQEYREEIAIKLSNVVFTIVNSNKQSEDFITFYKSITIEPN